MIRRIPDPPEETLGTAASAFKTLNDGKGRRLDYLRLSVTDRCNLRCRYCLPAVGLPPTPRSQLLSWDEMYRLCRLFTGVGICKIRLTGGEPLLRPGVFDFLERLGELPGTPELLLTTNATLLTDALPRLREVGVRRLNISLDSLQPDNYRRITRGGDLATVLSALDHAESAGFGLKINMVVMTGINDHEIADFVDLTRHHNWTVRFIEPMPFDGQGGDQSSLITGDQILQRMRNEFSLCPVTGNPSAVDELYSATGHRGRVGIIRGHSRTFCASCSRLRVSARGELRTCLYGHAALDLRELLQNGTADEDIITALGQAVRRRSRDGLLAQALANGGDDSMSRIGG
ncbi:MAG: GTP 3',8-cyclase MoaA [bacterium]